MSEEEAIERLKERVKLDRKIRNNKIESDYEQFCENECQAIEAILNLADKQQKEIEEKNVAINKMSKDISRQLEEIEEKTTIIMAGAEKVKQLEKEIQRLEKDNDTLSELVIVNEDKVIKELDLISKDKIREKIEHYNNELEHIKNGEEFENEKPMYYWGKVALENLLEEN